MDCTESKRTTILKGLTIHLSDAASAEMESLHISKTTEGFQVGDRHDEIYLFFVSLAAQSSMRDLSSLTRDRTLAPCSGSLES